MKTCQNNANPSRFATAAGVWGWSPLVGSAEPCMYIGKCM